MRLASTIQSRTTEFVNQHGDSYAVSRGTIHGICHIQLFQDDQRNAPATRGLVRFTWAFAATDRSKHVYLAILEPRQLLPSEHVLVRAPTKRLSAEVIRKNVVLDTRGLGPIRFEDGHTILSDHKYNDISFIARCEQSHLAIQLRLYVGDQATRAEDAYATIEYDVPYEPLLWRKASLTSTDDTCIESASYVDIRHVGSLDDRGTPPGLDVSPIEFRPSRG